MKLIELFYKSVINIGKRRLLFLLITPLIIFPIFWFVSSLLDLVVGDRLLLFRIFQGSKSQLLKDFIGDWIKSLPASVAFVWFIFTPLDIAVGNKVNNLVIRRLLVGTLSGLVAAIITYHLDSLGLLIIITVLTFSTFVVIMTQAIEKSAAK